MIWIEERFSVVLSLLNHQRTMADLKEGLEAIVTRVEAAGAEVETETVTEEALVPTTNASSAATTDTGKNHNIHLAKEQAIQEAGRINMAA